MVSIRPALLRGEFARCSGCPTPPAARRHTPGTGLTVVPLTAHRAPGCLCPVPGCLCPGMGYVCPSMGCLCPVWATCSVCLFPAARRSRASLCTAPRRLTCAHHRSHPRVGAATCASRRGCAHSPRHRTSKKWHPCPLPHAGGTLGKTGGTRKPRVVCPVSYRARVEAGWLRGQSLRAAGSSPC